MKADVVIIGGGIIGASIAWWTARNPDFTGRIMVIEKDPTYEFAATTHTNSCIRQQFGTETNIAMSRFGAEFIRNFHDYVDDLYAPDIPFKSFGYLYLADTPEFAASLKAAQKKQAALGAGTRIMTPEEIAAEWPFYDLEGIRLGSHNPVDEGYFDGATVFDWMKRDGKSRRVEYVQATCIALRRRGRTLTGVLLDTGEEIECGYVVNAAGTRANEVMGYAELSLPVEPRKRFTFVFDAAEPLEKTLPLTIDPSGVHVRQDGAHYMAGCPPVVDGAVDPDDFEMDHTIFEEKVWPALAARIPAFERIKVMNSWVGHYDYNTLDQNAVLGFHAEMENLILANGFSGHGLQHAPAVGRGLSELIIYGHYRSMNLTELGHGRVLNDQPLIERAVI